MQIYEFFDFCTFFVSEDQNADKEKLYKIFSILFKLLPIYDIK